MSDTIIKICNMALTMAGEPTITSLAESSKSARICDLRFADVRDSVLRAHPWNCATKRASLAQLEDAPAYGFTYQFQLPADYLRLVEVEDPDMEFKVEGRAFLTDSTTVKMRYVYRVVDVAFLDELCRQAIAAKLAHEICLSITRNAERAQVLLASYKEKLAEARFIDAGEGRGDTMRTESWLQARLSGGEQYRRISEV